MISYIMSKKISEITKMQGKYQRQLVNVRNEMMKINIKK